MSGFSADWLRLREPADTRARSQGLVFAAGSLLPCRPLHAIDLGAGLGANIRYMAARLEGEQRWLAVDNDRALLAMQPATLDGANFHCKIFPQQLDLASDLQSLPLSEYRLVSASALLDLVSASWLDGLATRCADVGAAVLFALNYDGRVQCLPADHDDEWVIGLLNRHQRGDKGFGPALGPDATRHAREVFVARGFQFRTEASDWLIGPGEQALQRELIAGWLQAAHEIAPMNASRIDEWGRRRIAHLSAGTSHLRVGHQDFMAWPTALGV
jgi:hypothetical protein